MNENTYISTDCYNMEWATIPETGIANNNDGVFNEHDYAMCLAECEKISCRSFEMRNTYCAISHADHMTGHAKRETQMTLYERCDGTYRRALLLTFRLTYPY